MLILQSGLPKSGNLWLDKIIRESLRLGKIESKSFIRSQPIYQEAITWPGFAEQASIDFIECDMHGVYFRKGAFRQQIHNIDNYLNQCTHVWTHTMWFPGSESTIRKFDKIVYIVRDPRDVVVSASKYFFTPFMLAQHPQQEPDADSFLKHRLYEQILTWIQHVGGYLLHSQEYKIHFVFYERLLYDFDGEYASLLDYLGIMLSPEEIREVKDSTRFETMKRKNPHHLRKGRSGGWTEVLLSSQIRQIGKMAGPMMEILGYSINSPVSTISELPAMPRSLNSEKIRNAIAQSRGKLKDKFRLWELCRQAQKCPLR